MARSSSSPSTSATAPGNRAGRPFTKRTPTPRSCSAEGGGGGVSERSGPSRKVAGPPAGHAHPRHRGAITRPDYRTRLPGRLGEAIEAFLTAQVEVPIRYGGRGAEAVVELV